MEESEKMARYATAIEAVEEVMEIDNDEVLRPTLVYLKEQRRLICNEYHQRRAEQ